MALRMYGVPVGGGTHAASAEAMSEVQALRVLALGNSITSGLGSTDGAGYRGPLFRKMLHRGEPIEFVGTQPASGAGVYRGFEFTGANAGFTGFHISQVTAVVAGEIAGTTPDVILLHSGANDMNVPRGAETRAGAPGRLTATITAIHDAAPSAHIYLASLIPSTPASALDGFIQAFNAALPAIVSPRSAYCTLVDMYAAFVAYGAYFPALYTDFLHPNNAGYEVMATAWAGAL